MNMITGFIEPTEGEIIVEGYDISKKPKKAKSQIGYMPEGVPLYSDLTVKEFVNYMAELKRVDRKVRKERVEKIIEQTGLKNVENKLTRNLSRGYKQRVSMAGALVGEPKILILDEPTNGLDIEGIIEMRNLIKKLSQQGMAILISSHNLTEIDNLCNRIIAIKDGKIVTNDTIENFKKDVKNNVSYELKLNSLDKIEKFIFDYKFELLKDNIIKVYISKENISNLIKKLIENGYQIYSVQEVKISSEEAFLKKVGDKKDD